MTQIMRHIDVLAGDQVTPLPFYGDSTDRQWAILVGDRSQPLRSFSKTSRSPKRKPEAYGRFEDLPWTLSGSRQGVDLGSE